MSDIKVLTLPFNQSSDTVKAFEFLNWFIYINRARPCEENHSMVIHKEGEKGGGRFWVTHSKPTLSKGFYSIVENTRGEKSFIHRITVCIRETRGVTYLQLIFFSWWMAVVRKDQGQFQPLVNAQSGKEAV